MIDKGILRTIEIEIIPIIGIEATQIIEIKNIKTKDHEIILATDQIIKDVITTIIKIGRAIIHEKRNSIYRNRQRNYSQSTHRNSTHYPDSQNK